MTNDAARQLRALLERQTDKMDDAEIVNFPAFVEKWQADVDYTKDKRIEFEGTIYKVLTAHKSQSDWTPSEAPSLFAKVLIPDPTVIPEWEQPDSTNPYMSGDKVTYNGKTWISEVDNNVWAPGTYGWAEVV